MRSLTLPLDRQSLGKCPQRPRQFIVWAIQGELHTHHLRKIGPISLRPPLYELC